jgi:hypothetical protein
MKIRLIYMTIAEISNIDTMKILHHAFRDDFFETITVIAEQDSFKIIGMDKSSSIAAQTQLNLSTLVYSYDSSVRFPVLADDFGSCLGYSTSTYIPSTMPVGAIRLTIQNTNMSVFMTSRGMWSLQKVFLQAQKGIESLPQLPSFYECPYCTITNTGLIRLCYMAFKESKTIFLHVEPNKITFRSSEKHQVFEVSGEGCGTASTVLTPYTLDVISRVCELSSLENLKISISQGGLTRFYYTFIDGTLEYVAARSGEE